MATGSIGGQPTTTVRNFTFNSNLSNFIYYTVPSNTISYVDFLGASSAGLANFSSFSHGHTAVGSFGLAYRPLSSGTGAGIVNGAAPVAFNYVPTATILGATNLLYHRIDGSVMSHDGSTFRAAGRLILYPGESLYMSCSFSTANTVCLTYSTLEITSGA